jgi:hypothetical protein
VTGGQRTADSERIAAIDIVRSVTVRRPPFTDDSNLVPLS